MSENIDSFLKIFSTWPFLFPAAIPRSCCKVLLTRWLKGPTSPEFWMSPSQGLVLSQSKKVGSEYYYLLMKDKILLIPISLRLTLNSN